jgi:hypothetical protein
MKANYFYVVVLALRRSRPLELTAYISPHHTRTCSGYTRTAKPISQLDYNSSPCPSASPLSDPEALPISLFRLMLHNFGKESGPSERITVWSPVAHTPSIFTFSKSCAHYEHTSTFTRMRGMLHRLDASTALANTSFLRYLRHPGRMDAI